MVSGGSDLDRSGRCHTGQFRFNIEGECRKSQIIQIAVMRTNPIEDFLVCFRDLSGLLMKQRVRASSEM
jgi:hypothetical protein